MFGGEQFTGYELSGEHTLLIVVIIIIIFRLRSDWGQIIPVITV